MMNDLRKFDAARLTRLVATASAASPHPFDWIGLLERPAWWRFGARRAHYELALIFAANGFRLTPKVARRFAASPAQRADEHAHTALARQLGYALDGQLFADWQDRGQV